MKTTAALVLLMSFAVGRSRPGLAASSDRLAMPAAHPYPGEREFLACPRPLRAPAELRAAEPEILDLVAWISNMGCRRFVTGTRASLEGRRVPVRARPADARDAYRVFYRALQSLSPGLTVVPAGDDLRITESAPPPLAAARNRLHVGPG